MSQIMTNFRAVDMPNAKKPEAAKKAEPVPAPTPVVEEVKPVAVKKPAPKPKATPKVEE